MREGLPACPARQQEANGGVSAIGLHHAISLAVRLTGPWAFQTCWPRAPPRKTGVWMSERSSHRAGESTKAVGHLLPRLATDTRHHRDTNAPAFDNNYGRGDRVVEPNRLYQGRPLHAHRVVPGVDIERRRRHV